MSALLSVIIPVFNTEKYLKRCLNSILSQSYKDFEIIIVDDCSTDGSYLLCKKYAETDKRISVYQNPKNLGVSETRNNGLSKVNGDYVYFIDSDDYIEPEMFSSMMAELINNGYDFCVCQFREVYPNGLIKEYSKYYEKYQEEYDSVDFDKLMIDGKNTYDEGVVCSQWNKIYKREVFNGIRFIGRYAEDYRIADLINSRNYRVRVLKQTFYNYTHENQSSITHQGFSEESFAFLDMLAERQRLYSFDHARSIAIQKKYCDLLLEYYEKAKHFGVAFPNHRINQFKDYVSDLKPAINKKTYFRYRLFLINPDIYLMAIRFRNKIKKTNAK